MKSIHTPITFMAVIFIILSSYNAFGQEFTLSGYIYDVESRETLIGANVYNKANNQEGTSSNVYGFYSITLPQGSYEFVFSYLGFQDKLIKINLDKNIKLDVELSNGVLMNEVVVLSEEETANVKNTKMGTVKLPVEDIKKLPLLMGETDVLKAIQLLPGVVSAGEGGSGFFVRGGGADQNLVLLDEAVVYNTGHLMGFFSVFNGDAIKNVVLIKGNMPANYGGRLSSVVDVQLKDGNKKRWATTGGIGTIASRFTIEGPIVKNKSSFIVSGRRTYAGDIAQPFLKGGNFEGSNYYFYDLNLKADYIVSDKDKLFLSGYFGRDVFKFASAESGFSISMPYGNQTVTARWNHLFSDKLFLNTSLIYNGYNFNLTGSQTDFSVKIGSGVRDVSGKLSFDYFVNKQHHIKFGLDITNHALKPNVAEARSKDVVFSNKLDTKNAWESGLYVLDDWKINAKLSINAGARFSMFTQVGPYTSTIDNKVYGKSDAVVTYSGIEPRVSFAYAFNDKNSIKGGIAFANQYIHLVSNSSSTLPLDVWVPSTELVKPQRAIQYALGYFRNFNNNMYETSFEAYYKNLRNQIDYNESYVSSPTEDVEQSFVFGRGYAFGGEFLVRKNKGDFTGWIAYTLSKSDRVFKDINKGEAFPIKFDKTHDLSVVMNYDLSPKFNLGAVFVYGTGNTYTPIKSLFIIDGGINTNYGNRNSERIKDYHRLDLSLTYTPKPKSTKRFKSTWNLSIYNAYSRKNTYFIYYKYENNPATGTLKATGVNVSLFPIIPAITWNFEW